MTNDDDLRQAMAAADLRMSGPEHYREAQRLIARYRTFRELRRGVMFAVTPVDLTEAAVHATLALAAATALPNHDYDEDERGPWLHAAGSAELRNGDYDGRTDDGDLTVSDVANSTWPAGQKFRPVG